MGLDQETRRALAMVSGLGFSIAFCLGGSLLAGLWLDDRFHTRPLFILLGVGFGLFGAASIIYRLMKPGHRSSGPPEDDRSKR
jgi:hypothetical protein